MRSKLLILILIYSITSFGDTVIDPDIQIKINGLVCPSCGIGVTNQFKKKPEVKKMKLDAKKQSLFIEYWNIEIHPSYITKMVKDAGYEVTSITWLKKKNKPNRYNAP